MHGGRGDGHAERQIDVLSICTMYVKKYEFCVLSQLAECTRLCGTDCAWATGIVVIFLLTWHDIEHRTVVRLNDDQDGSKRSRETDTANGMAHWYGAVPFREAQSGRPSLLYAS